MSRPVTIAIVGAGSRGTTYATCAARTDRARVVALAEPREFPRATLAAEHAVPTETVFADWRELADRPRLADVAVIATQDRAHAEPAVALARRGYHLLLEKPMATTEADCERIVRAAEEAGVLLAVCHVLRYTPYSRRLKDIVDSGRIGDVVTVEHLEPVGWWHHAHSYVRGNWRREDESTFMLMAKSCHDLDWLAHVIGRPAVRVSSFGGLYEFRPERRPPGAADRCLDCAVEPTCPYSAPRIYLPLVRQPERHWPLSVVTDDRTEAGVRAALREGPYGRCVYACDNDVVDHQVVDIEYTGGVTASFTMTAFAPVGHRRTRIFGTRGSLEGDGESITVHDFLGGTEVIRIDTAGATADDGHGGGDQAIVDAFVAGVAEGDPGRILTSGRDSLATHRLVWAAERARRTGSVVNVDSVDSVDSVINVDSLTSAPIPEETR
ncbi:Oxidoreductase family, C-terminal alpha/beta domain [Amycolatopsis arida]|uniref:Oxidoreductase family, C-terminal alpha/beta domain n=1 Tax=Amycolatopsis arida TaxID=587909 RepID=A0A1I5LY64_9PSEU|nr:Gfo/Idh/MocA family oxidoreductase [Amycolatopsis arida]TDX93893.1 oxidoreductase family protein [Amycolatopsis arida]SFP02170.1 Oxidoreductase family, C-terminal alpha/beta domain [Amycolatopsis arida]